MEWPEISPTEDPESQRKTRPNLEEVGERTQKREKSKREEGRWF